MTNGQKQAAEIIRKLDMHIGAILKVLTVTALGLAAGLAWRTNSRLAYALLALSIFAGSGAFTLSKPDHTDKHQRNKPKA